MKHLRGCCSTMKDSHEQNVWEYFGQLVTTTIYIPLAIRHVSLSFVFTVSTNLVSRVTGSHHQQHHGVFRLSALPLKLSATPPPLPIDCIPRKIKALDTVSLLFPGCSRFDKKK
jgi:hypothetical protein